MLDGLKKWFGGRPGGGAAAPADWSAAAPWARARGLGYREVHGEGFVVDGRLGTTAWRLEWGPSQRPYIDGAELRLRAETGLSSELQVVVMNRPLMEQMEHAVFQSYVEDVQTRIDEDTPPEMRWLVLFPKLAGSETPLLPERFATVASIGPWARAWLNGALATALASHRMAPDVPLVLTVGRGRVTLRTALPDPEPRELERWQALFETAVREAHRVVAEEPLLATAAAARALAAASTASGTGEEEGA